MKILVVTQKIDLDDDNLAFFHGWISALAEKADLAVVANFIGRHELPENVKIFSLGKERNRSRAAKFLRYQRLLLNLLPKIDGVFFHMCPEYVIAAGVLPKIFGKKTLLWYTHKHINRRLWLAEKLVDKIFTASSESCRFVSDKVEVTGHGIDLEKFKIFHPAGGHPKGEKLRIVTVGRITPIKNLDILIEAADILKKGNFDFEIEIAGATILESDKIYFSKLKEMIVQKSLVDRVRFLGIVKYGQMAEFYRQADLMINLSDTGSVDKAVLEAMASGCLVLTSNEAFKSILAEKYLTLNDPAEIAQKLIDLSKSGQDEKLRQYVFGNHNLDNLVNKIIRFFENGK